MIRKRGTKWVLLTQDGDRVLGEHPSREAAERQEQAIEVAKRHRHDSANALHDLKRLKLRRRRARNQRLLPPLSTKDLERIYRDELWTELSAIRATLQAHLPQLLALRQRMDTLNPIGRGVLLWREDAWTDEVARIFQNLHDSLRFGNARWRALARRMAQLGDDRAMKSFKRTMRAALGVDVFGNSPRLASILALFEQENAKLIGSLPTRFLAEAESTIIRGFRSGNRAEEIQEELDARFQVGTSRAQLIARDQVSKLNGELIQDRQQGAGITAYFWRTSRDERVRPSHAELEGQRIEWDDPPDVGHPGEDYQCRCHPDPDLSDLLE